MNLENQSYQSLINLQTVCLDQNIPFASYRLPLQHDIVTLVQYQSFPEKIDVLNELSQRKGFIVAPFFETTNHGSYILEPDNIFYNGNIETDFIDQLSRNSGLLFSENRISKEFVTTPREDFISQVNDARQSITQRKFHKVVLSKVRVENLESEFNAGAFFLHLCETYPHAFVYMIQLPEVGCWAGATPEPLLLVEAGKVRTVSLAGTQLASGDHLDAYSWSEKEIEEQGIVTGFVENTLHSLKIENYALSGPSNYQAANLIHLKTGFEFNEADIGSRLGDCLKALHPTPSVGGLPKESARNFILKKERHDRTYYTGYLGPLNLDSKSCLYVNLRCLQLFKKKFVLYSGAGITASSIAENEWEETDNKMLTMMNAMKKEPPTLKGEEDKK